MTSIKRGFTLLELLTVVGMIALIMGAMTAAVGSAHERARIQKAQADVKSVTQAVLGYENQAENFKLPTIEDKPGKDVDASSIGFLLGKGGKSEYGADIPVLLMAALSSGGVMRDPWGTPYKIRIHPGVVKIEDDVAVGTISTGYVVPNFYRLSKGERQ